VTDALTDAATDLQRRLAEAQRSWQAPSVVAAVERDGTVIAGHAFTRDPRTFAEL
jgi:hypothetical protein